MSQEKKLTNGDRALIPRVKEMDTKAYNIGKY